MKRLFVSSQDITMVVRDGADLLLLLVSLNLEWVAPEFTKKSWMPAAACPRESGGRHDVTPAKAGVQSTAGPVTLVNATANCSIAVM
jgi:hypothetical protein